MKKASGFTLIELLVVISIIATLAAVLTPNVAQARQRANDAAVQAFTRQVVTAMEVYLTDNLYNKVTDISADTANPGSCATGSAVAEPPKKGEAEYTNLANYGVPYPFPQAVKTAGSGISDGTPSAGCSIHYDGKGGYGVAAQSITNNVQTLYNGQICNWKATADGTALQETLDSNPTTWSSSVACGGQGAGGNPPPAGP